MSEKPDLHAYPCGPFDAPFVLKLYLRDAVVEQQMVDWIAAHKQRYHMTLMGGGRNWYAFLFQTAAAKEEFRAAWQKYDLDHGQAPFDSPI